MKLQFITLFILCGGSIGKELDDKKEVGSKDCTLPFLPSEVRFHRNGEGNLIFYECEQGFKTLGQVYATCEDGQWSDPPPICITNRCPKTYTIEHGTVSLGYSGALLRFQCQPSYSLVGSSVLVCDGAEWNGTVPTCQDPYNRNSEQPSSHSFYKTHDEWLKEADYSCVKARDSVRPPNVGNAQPLTKWTFIEGKPRLYTLYRCVWGHVARGQSKHMYCQNGQWIGALPKCIEAVSTAVPSIPRDESVLKERSHEDWLEIADYTCMGTAEQPQRVPPAPVTSGDYQWRYAMKGGTPRLYATLRCNHGHRIGNTGIENIYCREGAWVGPDLQCVPALNQVSGPASCGVDNGGCAHVCEAGYGGARCSCREGYQLDTDGRSCRDIDECSTDNGGCEQICRNTDGGFKCHCQIGYELAANGKTCYKTDGELTGEIVPPLALLREG